MSSLLLENRIVLMIGAGRLPGPGLALALARQGAIVAANDLSPILLDPLCAAAKSLPGQVKGYVGDATRGMPLRAMIDEVLEDWGKIDILINNPRVCPEIPFLEMDEWDWQRTIEMNLNGPFLVSQLVARIMREQGQGMILNIVDVNEEPGSLGRIAYVASQSGLLAFSQAAVQELIAYNIQVVTLCPDRDVLNNSGLFSKSAGSTEVPDDVLAKLTISICNASENKLTGHPIRVTRLTPNPQPGFSTQE
jgi:NAD(P)-dependent dehydrogenase (short-subunit alcohol dehydrogenase family)